MSAARLLLLLVCYDFESICWYGSAAADEDPVVSKLRSQLMSNSYDYEPSESIEKSLRMGSDATQRTEDRPDLDLISEDSELSDFGVNRNVLNGYITDMSDINAKPVLRASDDTFMGQPDAAQNEDELSDAEPVNLSESATDDVSLEKLSAEQAPVGELSVPEQAEPAKMSRSESTKSAELSRPRAVTVKPSQPDREMPVMRAEPEQEREEELAQPAQMIAGQLTEVEQQQEPVQWSQQQGAPARQLHVVSPYLTRQHTTEAIPFKVLTGHGQKHGRRSGAGAVSYLQTQLNDTVVVAPLGPGPMPDFQLPKSRRQFREISDDEDRNEEITSSKGKRH